MKNLFKTLILLAAAALPAAAQAPIAQNDAAAVSGTTPVVLDVLANDSHERGAALQILTGLIDNGCNGTVTRHRDHLLKFVPAAPLAAPCEIRYTVRATPVGSRTFGRDTATVTLRPKPGGAATTPAASPAAADARAPGGPARAGVPRADAAGETGFAWWAWRDPAASPLASAGEAP